MAVVSATGVSSRKKKTTSNVKNHEMKSTIKEDMSPLNISKNNEDLILEDSSPSGQGEASRVRVVGRRVYDSSNGNCHQCRQKTLDFAAKCTNMKKNRLCTIILCHKCLSNRYGEKAEDVANLVDWKCPKCRDICNCSFCMKKKGHQPTGILVHTAKASGFASVSELLNVKGPEMASQERALRAKTTTPEKFLISKENEVVPHTEHSTGTENVKKDWGSNFSQQSSSPVRKSKKGKRKELVGTSESSKDDFNASSQDISTVTKRKPEDKEKDGGIGSPLQLSFPAKKSKIGKRKEIAETSEASKDDFNTSSQEKSTGIERLPKSKNEEKDGYFNSAQHSSSPLKKSKKGKRKELAETVEDHKDHVNTSSQEKFSVTKGMAKNKEKDGGMDSALQSSSPVKKSKTGKRKELAETNEDKKDEVRTSSLEKSTFTKEKAKTKEKYGGTDSALESSFSVNKFKTGKRNELAETIVALNHDVNTSSLEKSTVTKGKASTKEKDAIIDSALQSSSPVKKSKTGKKNELAETIEAHKDYDNTSSLEKSTVTKENLMTKKLEADSYDQAFQPEGVATKMEITLPTRTEMTSVANVDLISEDVGNALQLLEFCAVFEEALEIRKGQPESVLRDIMLGRNRRGKFSSLVQFQIQLLTMIQEDFGVESTLSPNDGKDCWLHALKTCVSSAQYAQDLPDHCFDGSKGFESLSPSQKLKLVVFLCDEALGTTPLRSWIDQQQLKFIERKKEAKEKVNAAKDKEKAIQKKLQDEVARVIIARNNAPLSIAEYDAMFSEIKAEAKWAHSETLETIEMVPKNEEMSDALRTSPVSFDGKGHVYWRLKGYNNKSNLLLQDLGGDGAAHTGRWFSFSDEEMKLIEEHISFTRIRRERHCRSMPKMKHRRNSKVGSSPSSISVHEMADGKPEMDVNVGPDSAQVMMLT